MIPTIDVDKVSSLIVEAAETIILPRYGQLRDKDIWAKTSVTDLATIADQESEAFLEHRLRDLYPDTDFIGEESISEGRTSLDTLAKPGRLVWVADPVDGTHNFVEGKREFGIMLAVVLDDRTLHGWIYDVLGRSMITAGLGLGAYRDGKRLHTAAPKPLADLNIYARPKYFREDQREVLKANRERVARCTSLGCAAHEYIHLAEGRADSALYARVKPWDHLAGALVVTEAGGVARLWSGEDYNASFTGHGILIASCEQVAADMQATFLPPMFSERAD